MARRAHGGGGRQTALDTKECAERRAAHRQDDDKSYGLLHDTPHMRNGNASEIARTSGLFGAYGDNAPRDFSRRRGIPAVRTRLTVLPFARPWQRGRRAFH